MLRRKSKAAKDLAKKVGEQHWQVRIGWILRVVIRRQRKSPVNPRKL